MPVAEPELPSMNTLYTPCDSKVVDAENTGVLPLLTAMVAAMPLVTMPAVAGEAVPKATLEARVSEL